MKKILTLILFLVFLNFSGITVFASESSKEQTEEYEQLLEDIGDRVDSGIDEDTKDSLNESRIYTNDPESVGSFSVSDLFGILIDKISELSGGLLPLIGKVAAAALICAFVRSVTPGNSSVNSVFTVITVVCSVSVVIDSVSRCVNAAVASLKGINTFMLSYIPVYSSIIITSGSPSGGTAYYVTLFTLCEVITLIANKIFLPLMSIVMAISIVEAINPSFSFCHIAESLKKLVKWLLGAMMTVFVGILSVQSIIGVSSDTVGMKAAKFAVSTFVPVIGGAVSDAYSTVRSSMGIIRSGIGGIGIIIIMFIALQPIILSALLKLVTMICAIIAEVLGERELAHLMNSTSSVVSMCLSTVVCVSLVFIISTALLMLAGLNLT